MIFFPFFPRLLPLKNASNGRMGGGHLSLS